MICSEFAGCNEAMRGVLKYNPFSLSSFVETMDIAMSLTESEKRTRMDEAYKNIRRYSFSRWTEDFLRDLKAAYKPVKSSYYLGIDFGNKNKSKSKPVCRDMVHRSEFKKLNIETCSTSLLNANKGVVIVEIEALPHLKFSKNSIPTLEVIE